VQHDRRYDTRRRAANAALDAPVIVAATIGNVFEWFDCVVYGFFAVTLSSRYTTECE
jgi:hypothetical protein